MKDDKTHLHIHILEKLDTMQRDIFVVRESQIRTEKDVAEHIRRTNLLEDEVKGIKREVSWLVWPVNAVRFVFKALRLLK